MTFYPTVPGRIRRIPMALALGVMLGLLGLSATSARATEAFNALNGNWSGGGSASFASGETEKLRCTAHYTGGGNNLSIGLKCASASAQINLTGNLDANGNRVSGDWNENSFGLSGDAHGSINGGSIRLKISGDANGYLTLSVSGGRHTVALSTQGSTLTGVNVSLGRRK